MDPNARSKLNTQIYEEACEWFLECRSSELDDPQRRQLDRWLRKSPEHLAAYLEISAIWNHGPVLDPEHKWDAERLLGEVAACHDDIVSLTSRVAGHSLGRLRDQVGQGRTTSRHRQWIASAASLAVVALLALTWFQVSRVPTYTTAVGEQRSIALADGSTVELNSRSTVEVRYSERERIVELVEGQALFDVAKNSTRPFIVVSGETRIRAVGTQFDVYRKRSSTIVTVLEGRVAVLTSQVGDAGIMTVDDDPPAPGHESGASLPSEHGSDTGMVLSAGEQAKVTPTAVHKTDHPNLAGATAWTQRQIVFESASLSEVAEEFNRYNKRMLVVEDTGLYDFHVSGVFSSTDPASLIRFLRERPGVQVIETPFEIRIEKKK